MIAGQELREWASKQLFQCRTRNALRKTWKDVQRRYAKSGEAVPASLRETRDLLMARGYENSKHDRP